MIMGDHCAGFPRMLATAAGLGLVLAAATPVAAAPPAGLDDLVGARASSGEATLRARGYVRISGNSGKDRSWAYWWNGGKDTCVSITTYDGRYEEVEKTSRKDCGKSGDGGKNAAVAVGAVALIGALALASGHKDRDRDRDRYDRYPPGASGIVPYELRGIIGMKIRHGEDALRDRGYKFQMFSSGNYSRWGYWWNKREQQCVGVAANDGRIDSIVTTAAGACGKNGGGYPGYDNGYGSRSYSPAPSVTCYPAQRTCYEDGRGYSAYWTSREFRY